MGEEATFESGIRIMQCKGKGKLTLTYTTWKWYLNPGCLLDVVYVNLLILHPTKVLAFQSSSTAIRPLELYMTTGSRE